MMTQVIVLIAMVAIIANILFITITVMISFILSSRRFSDYPVHEQGSSLVPKTRGIFVKEHSGTPFQKFFIRRIMPERRSRTYFFQASI